MIRIRVSFCASAGVDFLRAGRRDQPSSSQGERSFRAALACFLLLGLFAGNLVKADDAVLDQSEPPVRLKKKVKPQPEPATEQRAEPMPKKTEPPPKSGAPKEELESSVQDVEEKIREITNRISRNMNQAEERLQKRDAGDVTQQAQRDVVHDLDELIQQTMHQQQQQQQQQQNSSSSSSQNQRNQQGNNRRQQNQMSGQRPRPSPDQAKIQSGNNGRRGKNGQEESKIADLYKDVWGHLPETLRQEMDQYSREQFMAKYGDLLKQYYATIAEKGRRKTER